MAKDKGLSDLFLDTLKDVYFAFPLSLYDDGLAKRFARFLKRIERTAK